MKRADTDRNVSREGKGETGRITLCDGLYGPYLRSLGGIRPALENYVF